MNELLRKNVTYLNLQSQNNQSMTLCKVIKNAILSETELAGIHSNTLSQYSGGDCLILQENVKPNSLEIGSRNLDRPISWSYKLFNKL